MKHIRWKPTSKISTRNPAATADREANAAFGHTNKSECPIYISVMTTKLFASYDICS
jgi:hypothetical protein